MHSLAHYLTVLHYSDCVVNLKFFNPSEMASSSNPRKRVKSILMKRAGSDSDTNEPDHLDRWFIGNQESIADYYKMYSRKIIISPKVLSLEWLKEERLNEVRDMLKFQKLDRFLKLTGNTYPDLVKVF